VKVIAPETTARLTLGVDHVEMPRPMPASSRAIALILALGFAGYLGWAFIHSATDIPTFNDFEVYHYIGGVAAQRQPIIYELTTPHQQRGPFLYPPSASVLLIPLSWLPHDVAGVIFSIVKVGCLLLLWWGGARFSGTPPRDALGYVLVMLGPAIMLHRPVASDVGNGQINIIIAAAAVGGVWLMMASRRWCVVGCATLAWAIAMKITPALLLAVLLLNRQWKALAMTVALAIVLLVALPMGWFGIDGYRKMNDQYRQIAARFTFDWASPIEQITPTELFQFVRLQTGAASAGPANAPEVLPVPISGYAGERLFEPNFRPAAMRFWFILGVGVGLVYLVSRRWALRARERLPALDWTWDLAMLCAFIVLLSPRVQKAHLVMLIVPAAWLAARLCNWFAPEHGNAGQKRGLIGIAAYSIICALFLTADNAEVPLPGLKEPAHCLPLIGVLGIIAMMVVVVRIDRRFAA
jgi:hypothetical protein